VLAKGVKRSSLNLLEPGITWRSACAAAAWRFSFSFSIHFFFMKYMLMNSDDTLPTPWLAQPSSYS
jgi:hypothetical protein